MNERAWWSAKVRPCLHRPIEGYVAHKVEDRFKAGQLDVDAMFRGIGCKIELKFVKKGEITAARALDLLSVSQEAWAREWLVAKGHAFMLVGAEDTMIAHLYSLRELLTDVSTSRAHAFTWSKRVSGVPHLSGLPAFLTDVLLARE